MVTGKFPRWLKNGTHWEVKPMLAGRSGMTSLLFHNESFSTVRPPPGRTVVNWQVTVPHRVAMVHHEGKHDIALLLPSRFGTGATGEYC